jgi:alpha-D-xyloside xylohydrolase
MKMLTRWMCVLVLAGCAAEAPEGSFVQDETGIVVTPASDATREVRLQVRTDRIVRVTSGDAKAGSPGSLMVVEAPSPPAAFKVEKRDGEVVLETSQIAAHVSLANGVVSFTDLSGKPLLAETPLRKTEAGVSQRFNPGTDEAFYGSGQHQNAQMNLNGEDVELAQHNMDIGVPFVVSTRNYGVLWDNNGITRIGNPKPYGLASRDLKVRDMAGKDGGFTARYSIDGQVKLERVEKDINYQYIRDRFNWPKELLTGKEPPAGAPPNILPNQTVTWEGTLESPTAGIHKFQLYGSSYFKVYVDGKLVLDRWRQNWAAWYHNFDVAMQAGIPVAIKIDWIPNDGYLALLHNDPLPDAERHSLTFTSDVGDTIDYYFIAGANQDEVISGYRTLTGKAVMLPRWAYGFWQSRQRYTTQKELLDVVAEYRKRKIPLDNIVMDWFLLEGGPVGVSPVRQDSLSRPEGHARESAWHERALHDFGVAEVLPRHRQLQGARRGGLHVSRQHRCGRARLGRQGLPELVLRPVFKPARDMYWRQLNDNLNVLGVDAWWMDATEPDVHSNLDIDSIKARIGPDGHGAGREVLQLLSTGPHRRRL